MTIQELRELDAFCAEYVMGWTKKPWPDETGYGTNSSYRPSFQPTTNPSDSMDVLKKCAENESDDVAITNFGKEWRIGLTSWNNGCVEKSEVAETLELAICLFAKQLFSKTTK